MNDLISKLNTLSSVSRLNTVESAYQGQPGAQANFKGKWQGFDDKGNPLVSVNGITYKAIGIGNTGLSLNSDVTLRVGKGVRVATW